MPVTMSVLGLYRYNPQLFSQLQLPSGVDQTALVNEILEECAELETRFCDPEYMQQSIYYWSASRLQSWVRMHEALTLAYNPLWNKDGTVVETTTAGQRQHTDDYGSDTNSTTYGLQKTTTQVGARSGDTTEKVSAFNENSFQNAARTESTSAAASDSATMDAHTDTETRQAHSDTHTEAGYTDTIRRTEQGNIGVTTSQQMLREEMQVRAMFDMIHIILDEFKQKYCLLVY